MLGRGERFPFNPVATPPTQDSGNKPETCKHFGKKGVTMNRTRHTIALAALSALGLLLSGCSMGPDPDLQGQARFRQEQFDRITSLEEYRRCVAEATELDRQARSMANGEGKFLLAAKRFEACEEGLGGHADNVENEERMRTLAMAMVDYVAGLDIPAASRMLETFERTFPRRDLYLGKEQCSLVESMRLITGKEKVPRISNACPTLIEEKKRLDYWLNH